MHVLQTNKQDYEILSKPIPPNFQELSYLKKLTFFTTIKKKRKLIASRANTSKKTIDNELCIYTPGLHMEFLRCTSTTDMEKWLLSSGSNEIEVTLTGEVPLICIRAGTSMQDLLNNYGVSLKIIDIYGEELLINTIETRTIYNNRYVSANGKE